MTINAVFILFHALSFEVLMRQHQQIEKFSKAPISKHINLNCVLVLSKKYNSSISYA